MHGFIWPPMSTTIQTFPLGWATSPLSCRKGPWRLNYGGYPPCIRILKSDWPRKVAIQHLWKSFNKEDCSQREPSPPHAVFRWLYTTPNEGWLYTIGSKPGCKTKYRSTLIKRPFSLKKEAVVEVNVIFHPYQCAFLSHAAFSGDIWETCSCFKIFYYFDDTLRFMSKNTMCYFKCSPHESLAISTQQ